MKHLQVFSLVVSLLFVSLMACGESEEERRAREQARMDSLRQVEQQKIAEMMAQMEDSVEAEEQAVAEEEEEKMSGFVEDGPFLIQVGAWRSETKAESFVNSWSDRNYPKTWVVQTGDEATGDVWFRVRVGYFGSREAAQEFGTDLANEINTGFWVINRGS